MKRTSVGIWRRETVTENMFSGEKAGRVFTRNDSEVTKRIKRARCTAGGIGRMGMPWILGAARTER